MKQLNAGNHCQVIAWCTLLHTSIFIYACFIIDCEFVGTSPGLRSRNKLTKLFANYHKQLTLLEISTMWAMRMRRRISKGG